MSAWADFCPCELGGSETLAAPLNQVRSHRLAEAIHLEVRADPAVSLFACQLSKALDEENVRMRGTHVAEWIKISRRVRRLKPATAQASSR
jgi:hypothetical protein